jgi:predicted O-methyltransferase YrrM
MDIIDRIYRDNPSFHRNSESHTPANFDLVQLPEAEKSRLRSPESRSNWGVSPEFSRYLLNSIRPGMTTIETGSGVSTLIFAQSGAIHTAVSPHDDEVSEIEKYARSIGIDLSQVRLVNQPSEVYLPTIKGDLDIVFIDGKHAFPWPILDWYYTADKLRPGGLMMLDDTQLRSVAVLCGFLIEDKPRWRLECEVGRTTIFRKLKDPIGDVGWYEQPWAALWNSTPKRSMVSRARDYLAWNVRRP